MTLPATDHFNRANGTLGANWSGSYGSDLAIYSQTVRGASGADSSMYWSADAPNAAQYAQAKIVANATDSGGYGGPCVRQSSTDFVFLDAAAGAQWSIEWYNGGSWTGIGSAYTGDPANNDVAKITATRVTIHGIYQHRTANPG